MHRLLRYIADVRAEETRLTLVMCGYYFVLLLTHYLLKPARDSMFLVELGAEQLPLVFILVAVVVVPIVRLHARAARRLSMEKLTAGVSAALALSLVGLWAVLETRIPWLFYVVYIWVSVYGALIVSQFWLLSNHVFTASQGRRLFVVLHTAAMLGAFVGGEIANALVELLGMRTQDLLLVTAGVLVASLGFVRTALRADRSEPVDASSKENHSQETTFLGTLQTIRGSWLLLFIVAIIGLEMLTHTFVDYQFKAITVAAFPNESELTGFLATFYGRVSLIALAFQVFILPRLLRRYGVGSALFLMPIGLLIGSIFLLAMPGLWAAVFLRGTDQAFEHSANKVGRELLFLPLSMEVKQRVKVFIDVFVDRGFRGVAGALLLLFVVVWGLGIQALAAITILFILAWIGVAFRARKRYTKAFEEALREGQLETTSTWMHTAGLDQALDVLETSIQNADDRTMLYALQALEEHESKRIIEAVRPLLRYPSRDVRLQAIKTLDAQPAASMFPEMKERLLDEDPAIQRAAFHYRFEHGEPGGEVIRQHLEQQRDDDLLRSSETRLVHFDTAEQPIGVDESTLMELLAHPDPSLRAALADALAGADPADVQQLLSNLADDDDPAVRRAAIQSMGRIANDDFTSKLIESLGDDDVHIAAWNALSNYGESIVDTLIAAFSSPDTNAHVRRRIPRVLGTIPCQRSIDLLVSRLDCDDPTLRYNVTAALLRLRSESDKLPIPEEPVEKTLSAEIEVYYRLAQAEYHIGSNGKQFDEDQLFPTDSDTPDALTVEATELTELLQNRRDRSAQRIFQLLGLRYSQRTVRHAYDAFSSEKENLQALAVEWLDNVLDPSLRERLRPIIDPPSLEAQARAGRRQLGVEVQNLKEALALLIDSPDTKTRVHALLMLPSTPAPGLIERAKQASNDADERVRQAARHALNVINEQAKPPESKRRR